MLPHGALSSGCAARSMPSRRELAAGSRFASVQSPTMAPLVRGNLSMGPAAGSVVKGRERIGRAGAWRDWVRPCTVALPSLCLDMSLSCADCCETWRSESGARFSVALVNLGASVPWWWDSSPLVVKLAEAAHAVRDEPSKNALLLSYSKDNFTSPRPQAAVQTAIEATLVPGAVEGVVARRLGQLSPSLTQRERDEALNGWLSRFPAVWIGRPTGGRLHPPGRLMPIRM